jgi:RNA recognition motif-containing protein
VIGAKVVTSAKNPGSKCYGLVTLATAEEADNCIKQLNKTEFNGRIISLEKVNASVYSYIFVDVC